MTSPPPPSAALSPVFKVSRLVRFSDCDPARIVFFPQYFIMINSLVEDWWIHIGHAWTDMIGQRGIGTPVAHLDTVFVAPSVFGETLTFALQVEALGRSSIKFFHRILGPDGQERVRIHQRSVATSLENHRPMAWPDDIRAAIENFINP